MASGDATLLQYYTELQDEVKEMAEATGSRASFQDLEASFAEVSMRLMSEMGLLVSQPEICMYEGTVGNSVLRISACAVSDDLDRLDLLVSLYEFSDRTFEVNPEEVKRAAGQCLQFLRRSADGTLSEKLPAGGRASTLAGIIGSSWAGLDQVRIWVVTNGIVKNTRYKPQEIEGKLVCLEVVDLVRIARLASEGEKGDPVNVDFSRELGEPLPCVFYSDGAARYDTALCLVPAEVLRTLYEKYDARLLEANVRSFLSMQSKVNKGMFGTLKERPGDFLAFNNGIVVVADQLQLARTSIGTTGIKVLAGMKIVNGGQTTATIFFGKRRDPSLDISHIRVPAKIIVPKRFAGDRSDEFLTDIARFANTQNNVRASDLSSSAPFHVALERAARATWCPNGANQWFYERTTGSYRTMIAKEPTAASRRKKEQQIPPSCRITKLDLARVMNAWLGRPDLSCLSPQRNYALFMRALEDQGGDPATGITSATWKDIVSVTILFRYLSAEARAKYPGSGAVIAAYTTAIASKKLERRLRLRAIWDRQEISDPLRRQLEAWAREINGILRLSALGKPISEWGRDPDCWKYVLDSVETGVDPGIPELGPGEAGASGEEKPAEPPAPAGAPAAGEPSEAVNGGAAAAGSEPAARTGADDGLA